MKSISTSEVINLTNLVKTFFQPISQVLNTIALSEEKKQNSTTHTTIIVPKKKIVQKSKIHFNHDPEIWGKQEIRKLFKLYNYYGPQWKIMSEHMPLRTANNLKNRFYTVLRNLIKLLFREKPDTCPKLSGQIPSKDLSRLYDGKQDYKHFQYLVSNMLEELDYDLDSLTIETIVNKYSLQIIQIYKIIYGDRVPITHEGTKQCLNKLEQHFFMPIISYNYLPKDQQIQNNYNQQSISQPDPVIKTNIPAEQPGYFYLFYFNPNQYFSTFQRS